MDKENEELEDPAILKPEEEVPAEELVDVVEEAQVLSDIGQEDEAQGEEEVDITKLYEEEEDEDEGAELPPELPTFPPEEDSEGPEEEGEEQLATEDEEIPKKLSEVAPVEEEEGEAEEEEELEGEQVEEFTARPSGGQGDSLFEPEEEEEEEPPKEVLEEIPETEDILEDAAEEAEDIPPEPKELYGRPKIFICGEEETARNIQMESYCCQQIKIPPLLPHVLKTYTKGAIKTQPRDLLRWSAAYFRALVNNEPPPVKERLEYPTFESPCGLTKGLLRVLHKQLGKNEQVSESDLRDKWMGLCLDGSELTKLLHLNSLESVFDWTKFVVVASASIVKEHIMETMTCFCETMTLQPDGVDPYVPYKQFVEAYTFLAQKMGVDMNQAEQACTFLRDLSIANFDLIGPKDYMAQECPSLF